MSSILQALRELEASKSPATPGTGDWTDEGIRSRTSLETFGIIGAGLLLGAMAFLLVVWLSAPSVPAPVEPAAPPAPSAVPPPAAAEQQAEPATVPGAPPAWLERASPPRARVAPDASPAERTPVGSPAAPAAARPPAPAAGAASAGADVAVTSISYSADGRRRSVTMRVDGQLATLREGQSAHGVEVQLILPAEVYVRRGADIVVLEPER